MGVILKEMKKIGADGVDFVSIGNGTIYDSMTKEQIKKNVPYPRSNRRYWKMVNGEKVYLERIEK